MALKDSVSYKVSLGFRQFSEMYSKRTIKKTRLGSALLALFFAAAGIWMTYAMYFSHFAPADAGNITLTVILYGVALYNLARTIYPFNFFFTKASLVKAWFFQHGSINVSDAYRTISCDYDVVLDERGVDECMPTGATYRYPWFLFLPEPIKLSYATIFAVETHADEKDKDMPVRHLVGVDWFFDETTFPAEILFVPNGVIEENPGIVAEIKGAILQDRELLLEGTKEYKPELKSRVSWARKANFGTGIHFSFEAQERLRRKYGM